MKEKYSKPVFHVMMPVSLSYHAEDDRCLRVNPDIILRQIGDEWILVPTGALAQRFNGMISINETGHFIYEHFLQPCSQQSAIEAAKEEFMADEHMLKMEIREFIRQCIVMGILIPA